jgi:hypothetical protein
MGAFAKSLLPWKSSKLISVCVTLVIQHAERMNHIILSSVAYLAPPYFSTVSHKRYDFRKESQEI